ncbi:MAG: hypothetical protein ABIH34_00640 [Nanoarchaeota archaeon]
MRRSNEDIAKQRIIALMDLAKAAEDQDEADLYAKQAKRISLRIKVAIPFPHRRFICKKCGAYIKPAGSRTRMKHKVITSTCLRCGHVRRIPTVRERKSPRRKPIR